MYVHFDSITFITTTTLLLPSSIEYTAHVLKGKVKLQLNSI